MKATGIIRRIDDLGRVVIPREIRRTLGLADGDPLEFWMGNDGIILKKYEAGDVIRSKLDGLIATLVDDFDLPRDQNLKAIELLREASRMLEKSEEKK